MKDIEKIQKALNQGRVAIVQADESRRNMLAAELSNRMPVLRFSMPNEPSNFRGFVNGMLNTIVEAAGYSRKYPGIVFLEMGVDYYIHTDMPMAVMELLQMTTEFKVVIACASKAMVRHMMISAAVFAVPCTIELDEKMDFSQLIEESASRVGLEFSKDDAREETVRIYTDVSKSDLFNLEAFLKSLSDGRIISMDTIRAEKISEFSYIKMCLNVREQEQKKKSKERKIGFASVIDDRNERGDIANVY